MREPGQGYGAKSAFGSAFAQTLAQGLMQKRQLDRQKEDRQQQLQLMALNLAMQSGQVQDIADLEPFLAGAMPDVFGEAAQKKRGKGKGGFDGANLIRGILSKTIEPSGQPMQGSPGSPLLPGPSAASSAPPAPSPGFEGPVNEPALPGRTTQVQAPAAPRRTFMGIPLMSRQEVMQRSITEGVQQTEAEAIGKARLAHRLYPILKEMGSKGTLDDLLVRFGVLSRDHQGVPSFGEIPGEVDGKPTTGIIDHRTGQIIDPITREPIPGFVRRQTSASVTMGTYAERAAGELGYASAQAARAAGPEAMAAVNKRAEAMQAAAGGATTTARAEAAAKGPLSTAQRFNELNRLQEAWRKAEAPQKEMNRQVTIMETALSRWDKDPVGASEAIRVSFERILDPKSVVREGEFARQAQGLSLLDRFEGFKQQILAGGGKVPKPILAEMVETARQFREGQATMNDIERDIITATAKDAGLNPDRVFGVAAAVNKKQEADRAKTPSATGMTMDAQGNILRDGKIVIPAR